MAIYNLDQLRQAAPEQFKDYSDEALVVEYSRNTGQDPFEVANYFGVKTGAGKSVSAGFSSGIDMVQGLGLSTAAYGAAAIGARGAEEYLAEQAKQQSYEGYLAGNPQYERVENIGGVGDAIGYGAYQIAKQGPLLAGLTGAALVNPALGVAAGYSVGVGSLYESAREADGQVSNEDLVEIAGKSIPYALLETLTPLAFAKLLRAGTGGAKGAAIGGARGVAAEASTELGQTELEISMNPNLTEEQKSSMRLNAAIAGGLVGGGLGAVGGALGRGQEGTDLTQKPKEQPAPTEIDTSQLRQTELDIPMDGVYQMDRDEIGSPDPAARVKPADEVDVTPQQFDNEDQFSFDFVTDEEARIRSISAVENQIDALRERVKSAKNIPARRAKMAAQRIASANEGITAIDERIAEIEADVNTVSGNPIKPVYRREYNRLKQDRIRLEGEINRWSKDADKITAANEMAALVMGLDALHQGADITELEGPQLEAVRNAIPEEVAYLEQRKALKEETDLTVQPTEEVTLEGVEQQVPETPEVQATEEVVEAAPVEQVAEQAPAKPQPTGETLTEDEILDAAINDVDTESTRLEAEVDTEGRKPVGRVTMDKPMLAGIMRMIRAKEFSPDPKVYELGADGKQTARVDAKRTEQDAAKMRRIYKLFMEVAATKKKMDDKGKNIFYGRETTEDGAPVKRNISTLDKNARQAMEYQRTLRSKIENLIDEAGGEANVQALIAMTKRYRDEVGTFVADAKGFARYNAEFNKKGNPFVSMRDVLATIDTSVSSAFAGYRDGDLTETLDRVSPRPIRDVLKRSEKSSTSRLQRVVQEGGIKGLMELVTTREGTRSPYVIMLGSAIKYGIENMAATGFEPTIEFISEGNPYYDKSLNTIFIRTEASEEEILHETLHAATSWYVQQNPEAEAVVELRSTLDNVLNTATPEFVQNLEMADASKDRINRVLQILRDLKASDNPDDAVLELVSYGTTLRDFKDMLKEIGQPETPSMRSWKNILDTLWSSLTNLVARVLGVKGTAANSVLDNTYRLLESSLQEDPSKEDFISGQLNALVSQSRNVDITGKGVELNEAQQEKRQAYVGKNITRMFIEQLGITTAIDTTAKQFKKAGSYIRKELPLVEKTISTFNTRFGVAPALSDLMDMWKVIRNTPLTIVNRLITKGFENQSVDRRRAMIEYMDGTDTQTIEQYKDSAALKLMADSLLNHYNEFIAQLPEEDQALFAGKKFSDSLIYVASGKDVSNHNLSQRSLTEYAKSALIRIDQADVDNNPDLLRLDQNGDAILDEPLYLVTVTDGISGKDYQLIASKDLVDSVGRDNLNIGDPYVVHDSAPVELVNFSRGKYNFRETRNYVENMNDENTEKLTVAMLNTMAALSNYSASKAFLQGLANYDGEPVVYDSAEQIRARHENPNITITDASELKSAAIKAATRSSQHWIRVSDNETLWGPLAGKIIHAPVWHAMNDMSDRSPLTNLRWVNQGMTFFKKTKTVQNPGTHITNIASNVTLAMMHGIPMKTVARATKLLWEFEAKPERFKSPERAEELQLIQDFYESGALLGTFSAVEIKNVLHQAHVDALKTGESDSIEGKVRHFVEAEMGKSKLAKRVKGWWNNYDEFTTQLYAAEDNAFRLAAYLNKIDELGGDATSENKAAAGRAGLKMFLDYDIDAPAVKLARQSVFPFISWTYAAVPLIGRIAMEKPWQIANIMIAYTILDMLASGLAGDDDEARKYGPERLDERTFGLRTHIRIPFMGDDQNPVYYRLGDYIPLVSTFASTPTGFLGFDNWPQGFKPGGPLVDGLTIMMTGTDPYTGKSLYESTDSGVGKFGEIFEGLSDMFVPPWLQSVNRDKLGAAISGDTSFTGNDIGIAKTVAARIFGLKLVDYNRAEEATFRSIRESAVGREYKSAIRKLQREEMRRGTPDYEGLYEEIQRLELEMLKEVRKIYKVEE